MTALQKACCHASSHHANSASVAMVAARRTQRASVFESGASEDALALGVGDGENSEESLGLIEPRATVS